MSKFFRIFLFLLVSFFSYTSYATKAEQIDNLDKMFVYLETDSIRKSNDTISFWLIFDLKNEQKYFNKPIKSISAEVRANCKSKKIENVLSTFYRGNMGKGEFLIAESNQKFEFDIPSNLLEKYTSLACSR